MGSGPINLKDLELRLHLLEMASRSLLTAGQECELLAPTAPQFYI